MLHQVLLVVVNSSFDSRRLDDKIKKLDEQLMKHRDVIKKTRPGPGQDAAKRRALSVRPFCLITSTLPLQLTIVPCTVNKAFACAPAGAQAEAAV